MKIGFQTPFYSIPFGFIEWKNEGIDRIGLGLELPPDCRCLTGRDPDFVVMCLDWFEDYFHHRVTRSWTELSLNLPKSPFCQKVLMCLSQVGAGQTVTYGQLAQMSGNPRAARAVGQCMNNNPFPIVIPCHRVVSASGNPWLYAYGEEAKRELLAFERIP